MKILVLDGFALNPGDLSWKGIKELGTEPKLKTYISVSAENKETAEIVEADIRKNAEKYLK